MLSYLRQLNERERMLLLIAGPLILLLLIYLLLWRPLAQHVNVLNIRVSKQQTVLIDMQSSAQLVALLRQQGNAGRNTSNQSLLALVDRTVRQSGLIKSLKRVEPDGADKVKIHLEKASFDTLVSWLETLKNRYSITVQNVSIDAQETTGIVNARLTLVGLTV